MSLGIIAVASAFVVRSNLRDSGKVKSWDIFFLAILQGKEAELGMLIVFFSNSRPFITIKVTQHLLSPFLSCSSFPKILLNLVQKKYELSPPFFGLHSFIKLWLKIAPTMQKCFKLFFCTFSLLPSILRLL